MIRTISYLFLLAAILTSCTSRSGAPKSKENNISGAKDNCFLFDGKTLNGWEITNFGPQGPVYVSGDEIILSMGDGCTGITWKGDFPTVDYEVMLEAMKVNGNDFFCGMTFPVGKDPCTLIVGGWGGSVVGLSSINGLDASENETMTTRQFEKDRWYKIRLKVTGQTIQAWIDNEIVVDFTIDENLLSIRPEVELSKPFGIASWRTTAALRNIKLNKQ
jgi:hypothetical protein